MKKITKILASFAMIFALVLTTLSPSYASASTLQNRAETFFNFKKAYEYLAKNYHGVTIEHIDGQLNSVRIAIHLDTVKNRYNPQRLNPDANIIDQFIVNLLSVYDDFKYLSNDGYAYIELSVTPDTRTNTGAITTSLYAGSTLIVKDEGELELLRYEVKRNVSFTDVDRNHWARPHINNLAQIGIVNGSNGKYMPNDNITRAQFSAMLSRTMPNVMITTENTNFTDVKGHWARYDIIALYELGIVGGYNERNFGANDKITRQQAVAMMTRYLDVLGYDTSNVSKTLKFSDQHQIAPYARDAVAVLSNLGVISGTGDNKFNPTGHLTRAQMAKILDGVLQLKAN